MFNFKDESSFLGGVMFPKILTIIHLFVKPMQWTDAN
jgi:hypothetical protein